MMRRDRLDHILRAAAEVTGHKIFVLAGSSAIVVRCRNIPGDMLMMQEADVYVPGTPDAEALSDAIDANIGQGSAFHTQYGYDADGVSSGTSVTPTDREQRAQPYHGSGCPGVTAIVPDFDDVALARSWPGGRKTRIGWNPALRARLLSLERMASRLDRMPVGAPDPAEMARRLGWLATACRAPPPLPPPTPPDARA